MMIIPINFIWKSSPTPTGSYFCKKVTTLKQVLVRLLWKGAEGVLLEARNRYPVADQELLFLQRYFSRPFYHYFFVVFGGLF